MRVTIIAAADAAWGIGLDGRLPWRFPDDLKRFRDRTMGSALVMGRLTVESIGRHLPGRTILTVSAESFRSVADAVEAARGAGFEECFIAGGRLVYADGLGLADSAEITRVHGTYACDVAMPDLARAGWEKVSEEALSPEMTIETWKPARAGGE